MYVMREYREPRYGLRCDRSLTYGPSGAPVTKVFNHSSTNGAQLIK